MKKVATTDFDPSSSLDLMWRAFERTKSNGIEMATKTSRGLLSPYWVANYSSPLSIWEGGEGVVPSGNLAQWFDYAPYGSLIASTKTGSTTAAREFIGQFADASGLSYLNARYYNGNQGQFTSQDPMFLGSPAGQNLGDPQSLNSYSYSDDNPITKEDPTGKCIEDACIGETLLAIAIVEEIEAEAPAIESDISTTMSAAPEVESSAAANDYGIFDANTTLKAIQEVPAWQYAQAEETTLANWKTGTFGLTSASASFASLWYLATMAETGSSAREDMQPFWGMAYDSTSNSNKSVNFAQFSQINQSFQNVQTSNTIQSRTQAVSSLNAATGASTPQSQLWTTPSGAVVTWGGQLVAGPVSGKK